MTPTGIVLAAGGLALAIVGLSLGYLVLIVIASGIGIALTIGGVLATGVPDLEVSETIEPGRVERGMPAVSIVSARNRGQRRSRSCMAIQAIGADSVHRPVRSLAAGRAVVVRFPLPTNRRGSIPVGPLTFVRSDPLGLWSTRSVAGHHTTLFVEPRVHSIDPRPGGRLRHVDGPMARDAPLGSLVFQSLREYAPGDDVRRVHWRSSARTGTLMVREHVDTSLPSAVVVFDIRRSSYHIDKTGGNGSGRGGWEDGFESAVDVTASIVAASQRAGYPVRLITTDGTSLIARAGHRGSDLRNYISSVQAVDHGDFEGVAGELVRPSAGDTLSVVSGNIADTELAVITNLSSRFANATLLTIRPVAQDLPRWAGGLHLDGDTADSALARWHSASLRTSSQPTAAQHTTTVSPS